MKVTIPCIVALLVIMGMRNVRAAEPGYYSQPAVHENRLIFVSEGDLWTAMIPDAVDETNPIIAFRLTSGDGDEMYPSISPDGSRIAFSAEYDGNVDVYVMPIDGGAPTRLTFHPGEDHVVGWLPDSRSVLFRSSRRQALGKPELWRISASGGMPVRYDFGECSQASFSSTGRRIAFARWSNENWHWKRYRGGTAPEIWVGDLAANTYSNLTSDDSNDLFPMWVAGRVFFLSDRDGTANIWSNSAEGGDLKQHTHAARNADDQTDVNGYDIRWPYGEARPRGTRIVFCQGGQLAVLDVVSEKVQRLDVRIATDRIAPRKRFAPLSDTLTEFALSTDGKKLLVGARGELMMLPLEGGANMQLTRTSSAREWGASFLGADRIVLLSDVSGEQQVAVMSATAGDAPSAATDPRQTWLFPPQGSGDGRWIAYGDNTLRLHLMDMHTLEERIVDQSESGEITDYRFSPDYQWLAYTKPMPNDYSVIRLYSLRTNQSFDVSDGLSNDSEPRWDPAGRYLYFLSERNYDPVLGSFDLEHIYINTTRIVAVPLADNIPPPDPDMARAAGFDMEQWGSGAEPNAMNMVSLNQAINARNAGVQEEPAEGNEEAAEGDEQGEEGAAAEPAEVLPMRIDTTGITARQFVLPIEPDHLSDLEAIFGGVTYIIQPVKGLLSDNWPDMRPQGEGRLMHFDIIDSETKQLAANVDIYALSGDRRTLAVPVENGFTILTIGAGEPKPVDLSSVQLRVNIVEEWKQIFEESWRLQRDFYWAPNMVGVDWPAMKTKYAALLPRIGSREELNDVIGEMIGELGTSHTYIWGGEKHDEAQPVNVGLLGADIDFTGGFQITRIIASPANSDQLRSPLESPHLRVSEGNVIVGVNGVALRPGDNIYELLQDQAGKLVSLTIADDASGVNRRNIEVETLGDESQLRYNDWVRANYNYVREKTDGKIGYVHIPDMGGPGLSMFSRYFYPQSRMPAMIVDIRDNGGGFVSQMIIERLRRTPIAYDQPRNGVTYRYPYRALDAHLVALIDQFAGSDGDIFPAVFKHLELGPLIGTRTWGGVVGIRADKPFVDFGLSTQPEFAWWEAVNGWSIENYGVDPDIELEITPADRAAGRDPQLDKAIEYLQGKLAEDPKSPPALPAYPVRWP